MQRINLRAALLVILKTHPHRQGEPVGKALPEHRITGDPAADVADHAAQPNAQKLELAVGPLELVRTRIAPDHERGAFGDAPVALSQRHLVTPREIDQFFQGAMTEPRVGPMGDRFWLHRGIDHDPFEIAGPASAPVLCATDRLSWISATSCSAPSRWRQCVSDERSNRSL
jgi:hypothetical protein